MVMTLRTGDKLGQRDVIAQLIRMQYQRNDMETSRGKFRVRGDTIDVFPAEHSELAIRIELFDDEIESLQLFDPLTGRMRQKIPRFTVYPSSHYVTPRDKVLAAVETIKIELAERSKSWWAWASWWRRSAWSSAPALTWKCCPRWALQGH
jgi:excinuclease ABC subunit B